jgi:hypothetical protein
MDKQGKIVSTINPYRSVYQARGTVSTGRPMRQPHSKSILTISPDRDIVSRLGTVRQSETYPSSRGSRPSVTRDARTDVSLCIPIISAPMPGGIGRNTWRVNSNITQLTWASFAIVCLVLRQFHAFPRADETVGTAWPSP